MPWLPGMILMLRQHGESVLPTLLKEASTQLPAQLGDLADWRPPWEVAPSAPPPAPSTEALTGLSPEEQAAAGLLADYPAALLAVARLVGIETEPPRVDHSSTASSPSPSSAVPPESRESEVAALLEQYPQTLRALTPRIVT